MDLTSMQSGAEIRTIEFGPFRISTADRLLYRDGEVMRLFPRAVDVLLVLLTSDGRVVAREELIKAVWGNTTVEEGGLTSNISDLRKALGDDPKDPRYIETIPKHGYRWVGPMTALAKPEPPTPPPVPVPPRPIPKVWAAGILAVLLAVALVIYFWPTRVRSVAVFPLENLSRDPAQNYFT